MGVLERIYMASPVLAQNAMLSVYGLLLHWRRLGGEHPRLVQEVASWEAMTSREMVRREGILLRQTVVNAARNVPYYRTLLRARRIDPECIDSRERIADLPLLNKDTVRENPSLFYAQNIRAPLNIQTSGTSGAPLTVRCTREALQRNYAHFFRLREQLGIAPRDRCATFAGRTLVPPAVNRAPFWRRNLASNSLLFSTYHMTPDNLPAYLARLARFAPVLIDSYPSALGLIAGFAREQHQAVRPRAIITSSETLLPWQRAAAEEAFGCRVTDQYGSAEMAGFIAQCSHGTYHAWPGYGMVEVLVDGRPAQPGETGELVCTGYVNPAMPLLRYRTGDMAVAGGDCACGSAFPAIVSIEGRLDDLIITPDGRRVGRLDPVFKGAADDAFREAQIVQESLDRVVLRYVRGRGYNALAVQRVKRELQKRLGPRVHITAEEAASLPRGRNGKLRAVVSRVRQDRTAAAENNSR